MGLFRRRTEQRSLPEPEIAHDPGYGVNTIGTTGALAIADAYSCIRALVDAAASLPLHTYRRTEQGRVPVDGRGARLLETPSPGTTTANFVADVMLNLQLFGNAFVAKLRSGGDIAQLAVIPGDRVTVRLEEGSKVFDLSWNGERKTVGLADLVHVRGMSLDGLAGLSPVKQARVALGLSKDLTNHASNFFAGGALPAGFMKVEEWSNTERLQEQIANRRKAQEMIGLIPFGVDWVPLGMPLDDAEFLEQRKLSTLEICRVFRVPPWTIGAEQSSSQTYSNVEQESLHFATYSLRPWLVLIESALSADTDLFPGSSYCEFTIDALLRSDANTRSHVYERALDPVTGYMSRAEVRELENLSPEEATMAPSVEQMLPRPPAEAVQTNGGQNG
jgi:HK97 family phage portal protein